MLYINSFCIMYSVCICSWWWDVHTYIRLYFEPVEEHYIIKIIDKLKNKKSSGIDGISNSLIKLSKYVPVKPLAIMVNQMLNTCIFPI